MDEFIFEDDWTGLNLRVVMEESFSDCYSYSSGHYTVPETEIESVYLGEHDITELLNKRTLKRIMDAYCKQLEEDMLP